MKSKPISFSIVLLALIFIPIVAFSGCVTYDKGMVRLDPTTLHKGETIKLDLAFGNFEATTVTVSSIDWQRYKDGAKEAEGTLNSGSSGWKTGTVPAFSIVVVYEETGTQSRTGSFELRVVFHTSEGDFSASGTWTVLS